MLQNDIPSPFLQDCYKAVTKSPQASLYDGCMPIEETEIVAWMPDWSPKGTSSVYTRQKKILDPFLRSQRARLLRLRQELFDFMVSPRSEGDTSLAKTHPADAGTEVYERDFALSLLSQQHNALYEIDQALRRIDLGTYGICQASGKPIPHERLRAIPFVRFTVEVQSRIERENRAQHVSEPTRSLFAPAGSKPSEEQYGDDEGLANSED